MAFAAACLAAVATASANAGIVSRVSVQNPPITRSVHVTADGRSGMIELGWVDPHTYNGWFNNCIDDRPYPQEDPPTTRLA
jgi:hypothetical protein